MDSHGWEGWGLGGLVTLAIALFGHEKYKRRRSQGQLSDAEDTVGRDYVTEIAGRERDALGKVKEAQKLYEAARDEMTAMKIRDARRDVMVKMLMEHTLTLTRIVVENNPQHASWARESAFISMFDELQKRDSER